MDLSNDGVSACPDEDSFKSVDLSNPSLMEISQYPSVLARSISEEAPDPRIQVCMSLVGTLASY